MAYAQQIQNGAIKYIYLSKFNMACHHFVFSLVFIAISCLCFLKLMLSNRCIGRGLRLVIFFKIKKKIHFNFLFYFITLVLNTFICKIALKPIILSNKILRSTHVKCRRFYFDI